MSVIQFKLPLLETDAIRGLPALHPDGRAILDFIADACAEHGWHPPVVTCVGRTRDDQADIYAPQMIQQLEHQGVREYSAKDQARQIARGRFSWHCLAKPEKLCRAFDLRDWVYADDEKQLLMAEVRAKFPHAEILRHAVAGGAEHFHFSAPSSLGKPFDWL